jgi:hypothetical protein
MHILLPGSSYHGLLPWYAPAELSSSAL